MARSYSIGIDLGGTNIKAVAVNVAGEVLGRETRVTREGPGAESDWLKAVREVISGFEVAQGGAAVHVGMATPGIIAADARSVAWCPGKLQGIEGLDWGANLGREEIVPLLNDAHAALVGEHWLGAA